MIRFIKNWLAMVKLGISEIKLGIWMVRDAYSKKK
jgi:hypothetical protein